MANIKMDTNPDTNAYDLYISSGSMEYIEQIDEIKQRITYALGTFQGEWFLDYSEGFPWFQIVFKKPNNPSQIQDQITNKLLETEGVIEILEVPVIQFDTQTRISSITVNVRTLYGTIAEKIPLPTERNA